MFVYTITLIANRVYDPYNISANMIAVVAAVVVVVVVVVIIADT